MLIHFKIFDKIKVLKVNHNIDCVRQKIKFAESKRGGMIVLPVKYTLNKNI